MGPVSTSSYCCRAGLGLRPRGSNQSELAKWGRDGASHWLILVWKGSWPIEWTTIYCGRSRKLKNRSQKTALAIALTKCTYSGSQKSEVCPMSNAPCPMPHAPCPMPHAPCPMPYALCPVVPHLSEKGYKSNSPLKFNSFFRKAHS